MWNTLFTSCSEYFSCSALLCRSYFNLLNLQQMIIINAFHALRRRRLIAIQLHRRILRRRRRRHRRRFWRLPRPMNSWFEIHYNDPLIPNDYFKEQLRVRKETFEVILNHLNPHLTRQDTAMHDCIPPEKVLAIGLYRLSHGNSYVSIGPTFNVGKSTVIEAVQDGVNALFDASDQVQSTEHT